MSIKKNPYLETPVRQIGNLEKKRISYCMSSNRKQNLQKLIREKNFTEKSDLINKLGGMMKAASIESQIVCLERGKNLAYLFLKYKL